MGFIDITHEKTAKLLKENANEQIDEYVWAVYDQMEFFERENEKLTGENCEMKNTIVTLKEVIQALSNQHEDKGD